MKASNYIFITIALLWIGCSKSSLPNVPKSYYPDTQLDSTINGKNIVYPINQRFSLELDLNADGGYQWDCFISDTNIVCIDSLNFRSKSGNVTIVGGLGVETIYFYTLHSGLCTVDLIEHQGWTSSVPPIHTVRFFISVN